MRRWTKVTATVAGSVAVGAVAWLLREARFAYWRGRIARAEYDIGGEKAR